MEMIHIIGNTYYFTNPSLIGLYVDSDGKGILIDSGNDDSTANKILKLLEKHGIGLKAIINTHGHADHIGGNWKLNKETGARIYTSFNEKPFVEHPILEPYYIYGAYPPRFLRGKAFMAKGSNVHQTLEIGSNQIEGSNFEIVDLSGHSIGQIGVATPDGVLFIGDSVIGSHIANKYKLLYLYDVARTLETLEFIKSLDYSHYVLSHGGVSEDIHEDIETNLKIINRTNDLILKICTEKTSFETLHEKLTTALYIKENDFMHFLNVSLTSAHVSYLIENKKIETEIENNVWTLLRKEEDNEREHI